MPAFRRAEARPGSQRREMFSEDDGAPEVAAPRLRRRSRAAAGGERETVRQLLRDLPSFARLLYRLARDPRVSRVDKALVLATLAYLVSPWDLLPEAWAPILGQIDDIYLLALALDRLLNNAGVEVLLDHWDGDPASLEVAITALDRAAGLLPARLRELLMHRLG